jgi:intracellular sulfur oxidation DsrE/DsrF family protein
MKRRSMLQWMIAGSASLSFPDKLLAEPSQRSEEWLESIAGKKHRAFLDIRSFTPDGSAFRKTHNLFNALTESHAVPASDIGIAFGAGSDSIGHVLSAAVWKEFPVGKYLATTAAPRDSASLVSDPEKWAEAGGEGVREMLKYGVRVIACRNALGRWARNFAGITGEAPAMVNARLIAGLHPGVETVPAMIAAAMRAQERGAAYIAIG